MLAASVQFIPWKPSYPIASCFQTGFGFVVMCQIYILSQARSFDFGLSYTQGQTQSQNSPHAQCQDSCYLLCHYHWRWILICVAFSVYFKRFCVTHLWCIRIPTDYSEDTGAHHPLLLEGVSFGNVRFSESWWNFYLLDDTDFAGPKILADPCVSSEPERTEILKE